MILEEFLILLGVAALLGVIAQSLLGYKLGGFLISTLLGFAGGALGMELGQRFPSEIQWSMRIGDRSFPIFWSVLGALLVTFILGVITKSAAKHERKHG